MSKSVQVVAATGQEEERRRRKRGLAAACRLFARRGFDPGATGQISVRDPEWADQVWINPAGRHLGLVRAADLVLVDAFKAPALHAAIHQARLDVAAVVHVPTPYGQAWSTLGRRLDPITAEACAFYDDHIVDAEFAGAVVEREEGTRIAGALGRRKAAILRGRGLLTVGQSIEAAAWWSLAFEGAIQTQLQAEAVAWPQPLDDTTAREAHARIGQEAVGRQSFQALYDWIAAVEPDFLD
jgi:ribulose-5-phosphate 4-epimerase/fuculose-1-phosphate aldolase